MDKLAEASKLEQCRFTISIDLANASAIERAAPMRQWAFLLMFAVNNDLAEGRLGAAFAKWRCLLQMANHLRQQPEHIDHILATAIARMALESMARFVVVGDPSAEDLREIEAIPLPLTDEWQQHLKRLRQIEDLTLRKMKESMNLWDRLRYPVDSYRLNRTLREEVYAGQGDSPADRTAKWYRRHIATSCGLHILIALTRHRRETGRWPATLADIGSPLTDPVGGGAFVYRPTADGFELYSPGENRVDEGGPHGPDGIDDWPVWPPRGSERERDLQDDDDR
jgi:hypothetical protein